MNVTSVSLALESPLSTAAGTIDSRDGLLVTLENPPGIGEAMPLPGWTESLEDCRDALEQATTTAREHGIDAALADLDPTETPAARHGLDLAIADRRARKAGQSLSRYLAHDSSESVPVNATVGDAGAKETAERARAAVDAGFGTVKVKIGARSIDEDVSRIQAVRDAIREATIRVDANAAWTLPEARRAIDELATVGVSYVEQPLAADDIRSHAKLRGNDVEIALDESLRATGLDAIAAADAADVLVLKPMAIGGVRRTRSLALEARARGIDPVITTTIDGVVARTAAVHLAASLGIERACGLATADRLREDLASDPAPVDEGRIAVPDGPGIGVQFE